MKKFDLEKALAGDPILFMETGEKCWVIGASKFDNVSYIVEYSHGAVDAEKIDYLNQAFAMWEEPRPRVQLDLPAPLESIQKGQEVFYLHQTSRFGQIGELKFDEDSPLAFELFKNGCIFATKNDAQEWLDAMRNARR